MGWLREGRIYKLNKKNLSRVPQSPGVYKLYNDNRKPIYTGTTAGGTGKQWGDTPDKSYRYGLRHRISSYQQKDDYKEHPTKKQLRKNGKPEYFMYDSEHNHNKRREKEKNYKRGLRYNIR